VVAGVEFHAHGQGVLLAEAAEGVAGAGLDAANAEADGCPGIHIQILPDVVDVLLLEADNGNAGRAGNLEGGCLVFFRCVGDLSQLRRGDEAEREMGDNGIGFLVALQYRAFFAVVQHGVISLQNSVTIKKKRAQQVSPCGVCVTVGQEVF